MKANKWQNCFLCPSRGPNRWCWELKKVLDDMDFDKIHPLCPLADWPEMGWEDVVEMLDQAVGVLGEGRGVRFVVDRLRSSGVIIKEERKSFYVTFGQIHVHSIEGHTFDKDCVARIQEKDYTKAHELAMIIFKGKFCFLHEEIPDMNYYPRGIIEI